QGFGGVSRCGRFRGSITEGTRTLMMSGTRRRVGALLIGVLIAEAFTLSVSGAEKIKISVPAPSTTFAPLYHARAAGYFTDEGLDVDIVIVRDPGAARR